MECVSRERSAGEPVPNKNWRKDSKLPCQPRYPASGAALSTQLSVGGPITNTFSGFLLNDLLMLARRTSALFIDVHIRLSQQRLRILFSLLSQSAINNHVTATATRACKFIIFKQHRLASQQQNFQKCARNHQLH